MSCVCGCLCRCGTGSRSDGLHALLGKHHLTSSVRHSAGGIESRGDDLEVKKAAAEVQLDSHNADFVIYTDGSVDAGYRDGGAGVVVTRGVSANPTVLENICVKGAVRTCSCEEEVEAARRAVRLVRQQSGADGDTIVTISTETVKVCARLCSPMGMEWTNSGTRWTTYPAS